MRGLKATGLSEDQAEAITAAIRESRDGDLTNRVTKPDLGEAKSDIMTWVIGSTGLQTIVIVGAIVALSRAMHSRGIADPPSPVSRTGPAAARPPRG